MVNFTLIVGLIVYQSTHGLLAAFALKRQHRRFKLVDGSKEWMFFPPTSAKGTDEHKSAG